VTNDEELVHDRRPLGKTLQELQVRLRQPLAVQRAAYSAGGLNSSPGSAPVTTLSWFPRIENVVLGMWRKRSSTLFGSAA